MQYLNFYWINAKVAQLVEHNLAKVGVAGSSPVFRSRSARMVELVDTQDLNSCGHYRLCGFKSRSEYDFKNILAYRLISKD